MRERGFFPPSFIPLAWNQFHSRHDSIAVIRVTYAVPLVEAYSMDLRALWDVSFILLSVGSEHSAKHHFHAPYYATMIGMRQRGGDDQSAANAALT